jgi:glycosyltransferase involved in cell wall biosynthesis
MSKVPHIAVCICTYKRARFLDQLLKELGEQQTENRFTYSIVVADNDKLESARSLVEKWKNKIPATITYCIEPRQNIALTRNKALENAAGDFVSFIDDDEFPIKTWLLTLFNACEEYKTDGALGPVKPYFESEPPMWVVKGKFYDRPTYPTGYVIDWRKGRTGNCILKRHIFEGNKEPFNQDLVTGEDQDFFRRMIEKGYRFVWCDEALAYEHVPPIRWKRSFMLKRAFLRGKISLLHPTSRLRELVKSAVAVPTYLIALPFMLVLGQGIFMKYLIKTCDHAGKLLAMLGLNLVKENYVTE